jgi:hypothetical protein
MEKATNNEVTEIKIVFLGSAGFFSPTTPLKPKIRRWQDIDYQQIYFEFIQRVQPTDLRGNVFRQGSSVRRLNLQTTGKNFPANNN